MGKRWANTNPSTWPDQERIFTSIALGMHNFTLPLQNGQHVEVVCSLDHPETNA